VGSGPGGCGVGVAVGAGVEEGLGVEDGAGVDEGIAVEAGVVDGLIGLAEVQPATPARPTTSRSTSPTITTFFSILLAFFLVQQKKNKLHTQADADSLSVVV
jgi:hypothetical protein